MTFVPFGYVTGVGTTGLGQTFTRASTALYRDVNGVWQSAAVDTLRSSHYVLDPSTSTYVISTLREGAATNLLTYGRDLSNVAWTASDVTVVATVGADGGATSGSRLTATGANGTVIRAAALVHGSAAYAGSFVAKRITGTGNIQLTLDNGSTWTTVTLTAAYTQLFTTQTLANSQFGIRLVTSGDVIDVDFCQDETGAVPSSPIATAAAAVTRAADLWSFAWTRNPEAGTWYVDIVDLKGGGSAPSPMLISNSVGDTAFWQISRSGGVVFRSALGVVAGTSLSAAAAATSFGDRVELRAFLTVSGANATSTFGQSINSAAEAVAAAGTSRALDASWSAPTILQIGGRDIGTSPMNCALRSLIYVPVANYSMANFRTLVASFTTIAGSHTLSPISLAAELSWFGQPTFTVSDTGTNTLLTASATPQAHQLARLFKLHVSFSAAPNYSTITIQDGEQVIWSAMTSATGPWYDEFDFSKKPLRASKGAVLSVNVGPSGVGIVGTVSWDGDFVRAP